MKVVFLDRDGVINKFPGYGDYVTKVKSFHFLPGALKALKILTDSGYTIFIISNQAGVSKGVYSLDKLNRINRHMLKGIARAGAKIKKAFYCIHTQTHKCDCRKPKIGSIKRAMRIINKPLRAARQAFFVGDAEFDIQAGKKAGCKTIAVLSGLTKRHELRRWPVKPDFVVKNLLEATKVIQNENSRHPHLGRRRAHQSR